MAKPTLRLVTKGHNREPFEWEDVVQVRTLLRNEILNSMKSGRSASQIATKCKLSTSTVSKIGYGETKEPRATTCLILLRYFGYKVMIG